MDRGRPAQRSKRSHSRTCSESVGPVGQVADNWTLPRGMRVPEASKRMHDVDQQSLHKQAFEQAGNFEVLNKSDVASLSRVGSLILALNRHALTLRRNFEPWTNAATTFVKHTNLCEQGDKSSIVG